MGEKWSQMGGGDIKGWTSQRENVKTRPSSRDSEWRARFWSSPMHSSLCRFSGWKKQDHRRKNRALVSFEIGKIVCTRFVSKWSLVRRICLLWNCPLSTITRKSLPPLIIDYEEKYNYILVLLSPGVGTFIFCFSAVGAWTVLVAVAIILICPPPTKTPESPSSFFKTSNSQPTGLNPTCKSTGHWALGKFLPKVSAGQKYGFTWIATSLHCPPKMQWKLDLWYCALVVYNLHAQALGILVIRFEFIPLIEAKSIRDSEHSQAIRKNIVIDWNKLNPFRNMCLTNKTSEHSQSLKHHVQPPFVSKLPQVSCLEEKMESHLLAFTLPRLGIEGVWGSTLHCILLPVTRMSGQWKILFCNLRPNTRSHRRL